MDSIAGNLFDSTSPINFLPLRAVISILPCFDMCTLNRKDADKVSSIDEGTINFIGDWLYTSFLRIKSLLIIYV